MFTTNTTFFLIFRMTFTTLYKAFLHTPDKLVKECKNGFDIGELCAIAPFINQEVLDEIALKICENGEVGEVGELCAIASFVSKKALSELVEKVCEISNAELSPKPTPNPTKGQLNVT